MHFVFADVLRSRKTQCGKKEKELNTPSIAGPIVAQYEPKNAEAMEDVQKDIFGLMLEAMLRGEVNSHLGDFTNEQEKETPNRRNCYSKKILKTAAGEVVIKVLCNREETFKPAFVPKRK